MTVFAKYNLSPGAVASFTEPTPDLQRNYRQREMMGGIGQLGENGRWSYCLKDLVAIWISDRLSQRGRAMDRRDALRYGNAFAGTVIRAFLAFSGGRNPGKERYTVVVNDGHPVEGQAHGMSLRTVNSIAEIEEYKFDFVQVFDTWRLAKTIPDDIKTLLIVAWENECEDIGLPGLVEGLEE
ncbi:hypothetical protein [Oceaniglobus indicus]|uniref:hypothetical protein n=1 Tax=Oceaniglobus indicus TaxID=2047749 RepID=UPI000C17F782|nr:hypothetical protein [Oceaniglobus indicus]